MKNYISYAEADELCDCMIRQFTGNNQPMLHHVDIDSFVRDYLKCKVLYETFAEDDPNKIGFTGDGVSPLKIRKKGQIISVVYPKNTIVIERFLLRTEENARRRFTIAHEAGHILAEHISPGRTANFCREYSSEHICTVQDVKELYSIREWQANTLAAALLMPRFMIHDMLNKMYKGKKIPVYGGSVFRPKEKVLLEKMTDMLCVSYTALVIRLKNLGLLKYQNISDYIKEEFNFGGDVP